MALSPIIFSYTQNYLGVHDEVKDRAYSGFTAQGYGTVFPDAIVNQGDLIKAISPEVLDEEMNVITAAAEEVLVKDMKGFAPDDLFPYLVAAIQEQQAEITSLRERLGTAGIT